MEAPLPPPVALREDNVPDDLICSICMTVPADPRITPCNHLFCRTCIHQALGNQNLCPIDRQPCSPHQLRPLDGLSLRIWGGIQVKCGYHESGCIWTGSIADYSAHLESCSVYSNSNSALRRENASLKEQLEEKDEEITSLQTRLNEALRNNERNELRYRSTLDELNAMRERLAPPPAPTPPAAALIYKHGKTHAQLVQRYTNFYHLWNAEAEEAKRECDAAALSGQLNSDASNKKKWADYYRSCCASLAHYHLAISQGQAEPYQRPESPPAPPRLSQGRARPVDQLNGGAGGLQQDTLDAIKRLGSNVDTGANISHIIYSLQSKGYSEGEVRTAIENLSNEGMIYSTIDEAHFQVAE